MKTSILGSVALSCTLLFGIAACGDDDDGGSAAADTTSTAPIETTTTAPTTTATEPAPTTATTEAPDAGATIPDTDPAGYAQLLIDAWVEGDRDAAGRLAVPEAVDTLFSYETAEDGGTASWALEQCEGAAGSSYCTFGAGGDPEIVVRVGNEAASTGEQQAITEVRVDS